MKGSKRTPSASQDLSELTEHEKEKRAKIEVRQLQTQYPHGVCRRKFYDAEIWRRIQAQQKAIDDLTEEHRHVTLMRNQIYSPKNGMLENRDRMKDQKLFQTKNQYDALIKDRKAQLADLGRQILDLERKITKQRDITVKVLEARNPKRLQEQINLLELQLNMVTVQYNTILTRNNKLREETRSLQIQKAIFDNYYWKHHRKIIQQNKMLNSFIEQATKNYKQWMVYLSRISDIREVHYKETIQYNIRLLDMKCALHQETRLKNFFVTKCKDLSELKEQAKQREALKAAEWANQSQAESYEVVYKRLQELFDGDIEQFLDDFIEQDRRFFVLFGCALKLNVRNEGMRQRIKDTQDDMMAFTMEREQAETIQFSALQELEAKITQTTEEAKKYEAKCKESSKLLGLLQSCMEALLTEINCDTTKLAKPLGSSLMPLFGHVEEKMKELLLVESLLPYMSVDGVDQSQAFISPLQVDSGILWVLDRDKLCPSPPDPDSTDPCTAEEPLDKDQLHQMVIQRQQEKLANHPSSARRRLTTKSITQAK